MSASPFLLVGLALAVGACQLRPTPSTAETPSAAPSAPAEPGPADRLVVAELFTSEGCSSCPPADRLLGRLAAEADRDGAALLALSYHVDYWDRLGWTDPFGSPAWTARQQAYARTLDGRVYTPQLVVGGDAGFVGSRERQARRAIAEARREAPEATVRLGARLRGRTVHVDYAVTGELSADARVHVLLVQRAGASDVRRGENRGRRLDHVHIVRAADTREAGTGTTELALPGGLGAGDVFVAALVQPGRVGRILGAARAEPTP